MNTNEREFMRRFGDQASGTRSSLFGAACTSLFRPAFFIRVHWRLFAVQMTRSG
jgi:hypothetical protein